ncbi:MAG: M56 family metallopeptidase [Parabacteroides sp.]|nr:M56 family metallopeptidase [Parabacteroides sp.]
MSGLFLTVLNMSLTASYAIIFVIFVRLILKKAPKIISYALWGVVAFRLIIPFSFKSMFSLMPRNTNSISIPLDIIHQQNPKINSGIEVIDSFVSNSFPTPVVGVSVNPLQVYIEIMAYIWILGMIALLIYSLVSILVLKRQLKSSQLIERNIFEAKNLKTPFVLGLINPKIYLPVGLIASERSYILLHEQTHIHRKDHIIKVFAFLILSIHWFNPLVWIAFILMSTDMELSCDEKILKKMNVDIKKPYANSLLSLATRRHILNGSPLAFGEGNVKGRIKNVLNYKKPRFWVIVLAVIIAIAVGIGLLANPDSLNPGSLVKGDINPSMPRLIAGYMVIEGNLLYLDEVEILTREDTERIEELELELGENITTPSGYHIYNADTEKQAFEITKETTYTFYDYSFLFLEDGVDDRLYTTSKKEEFTLHLNKSYSDSPPAQKVPFFIEVKDGKVISITEKIEFTI